MMKLSPITIILIILTTLTLYSYGNEYCSGCMKPIEIVHQEGNNGCGCQKKIPYQIEYPKLNEKETAHINYEYQIKLPENKKYTRDSKYSFDFQADKPKIFENTQQLETYEYQIKENKKNPQNTEIKYNFDYKIEIPVSKNGKEYLEGLYAHVDKVLVQKDDCDNKKSCTCNSNVPTEYQRCSIHGPPLTMPYFEQQQLMDKHQYQSNQIVPMQPAVRYANRYENVNNNHNDMQNINTAPSMPFVVHRQKRNVDDKFDADQILLIPNQQQNYDNKRLLLPAAVTAAHQKMHNHFLQQKPMKKISPKEKFADKLKNYRKFINNDEIKLKKNIIKKKISVSLPSPHKEPNKFQQQLQKLKNIHHSIHKRDVNNNKNNSKTNINNNNDNVNNIEQDTKPITASIQQIDNEKNLHTSTVQQQQNQHEMAQHQQKDQFQPQQQQCSVIKSLIENGNAEYLQLPEILQYLPEVDVSSAELKRNRKHCTECGKFLTKSINDIKSSCKSCSLAAADDVAQANIDNNAYQPQQHPAHQSPQYYELKNNNLIEFIPNDNLQNINRDKTQYIYDRLGHKYLENENGKLILVRPPQFDDTVQQLNNQKPIIVGSEFNKNNLDLNNYGPSQYYYNLLKNILDNNPEFIYKANHFGPGIMMAPPTEQILDQFNFIHEITNNNNKHQTNSNYDYDIENNSYKNNYNAAERIMENNNYERWIQNDNNNNNNNNEQKKRSYAINIIPKILQSDGLQVLSPSPSPSPPPPQQTNLNKYVKIIDTNLNTDIKIDNDNANNNNEQTITLNNDNKEQQNDDPTKFYNFYINSNKTGKNYAILKYHPNDDKIGDSNASEEIDLIKQIFTASANFQNEQFKQNNDSG